MKISRSSIVVAIFWLILITVLLSIPGSRFPQVSWGSKIWLDKWVHLIMFLVMVILWSRTFQCQQVADAKRILLVITLTAIFYGIAMEIIQHYFIPFRSFDLLDIIADSGGAVIGYFIAQKRRMVKRI